MNKFKTALIIIDPQNDFCPGGALQVNEGDRIFPVINRIIDKFDCAVATQDWHPAAHLSFAINHKGKKEYDEIMLRGKKQTLWPAHCVTGTKGAALHEALNTDNIDLIIRKGTNPEIDSYSAFLENDGKTATGLHGYLNSLEIRDIFLCGLATDYCVFFSAMDAVDYGFHTCVIIDACRGIDVPSNNINNAVNAMKGKGVAIINSNEL